MTFWSSGLARSRNKLKLLYLLYHNAYGYKTWNDGDLPKRLLLIKSHHHIITWYCEIMWQAKTIIYPLLQNLWRPNLADWFHGIRNFLPYSHSTLWSRSVAKSLDKLNTLYVHYRNDYNHQTWLEGYTQQGAFFCKVTRSLDHEVLQFHVTK